MIPFLIIATLLSLLAAAVMAIYSRDPAHSVLSYMGFGLGSTVLYLLFSAPDVALTEAVIGAGVGALVFVVALLQTQNKEQP
ncbi:MAG: DUF4040 domain-containing protein [Campylobacterales bacterium]|nr:DUF4040 domain-containing protein [Campylobacterales bacterium]